MVRADEDTTAVELTILDWLAMAFVAVTIVWLAVLPLGSFGAIFRDLGSPSDLPLLTRIVLLPGFTLIAALPAVASLTIAVRARRKVAKRRTWIAAAFVLACVGHGVCLVAMYLPVFTIAGKIKED